MITLEEFKNYKRLDFIEDDDYIDILIPTSIAYIDSMVGVNYKLNQDHIKLAELLQYKLIDDMYSNRGTQIENGTKQDIIVTSILEVLSLD